MKKPIIGLLLASLLAGCSELYEPKPHITDVRDSAVISNTSALSHTFVLDRKTPYITCSQPSPDSSFSQGEEGSITIGLINSGGDKSSESQAEQSNEAELVGRSPSVLAMRELFFRLCEFSRNYQLTKDEAIGLYQKTLDTTHDIMRAEAENTTVKIGETLAVQEIGKVLNALPQLPGGGAVKDDTEPKSVKEFCEKNPDDPDCPE